MPKKENFVRYTADEIKELIARDGDKTNYDRVDSDEEILRQIATDPDLAVPENWEELVYKGIPPIGRENKRLVSVRYSPRVIDYFKSTGRGWQSRMDAVLTAFVDRQPPPQR